MTLPGFGVRWCVVCGLAWILLGVAVLHTAGLPHAALLRWDTLPLLLLLLLLAAAAAAAAAAAGCC
jgi:hypothetical protein